MIPIPIKPVYSLAELADVCGVKRRLFRKLLVDEGIEILGRHRGSYVSLSEIERKLPSLFEGIRVAHSLLEDLR
jgi:hypothetical protein